MFIEPQELKSLLDAEQQYIETLEKKWGKKILPHAEEYLRMGMRTMLLGDLQKEKEDQAQKEVKQETKAEDSGVGFKFNVRDVVKESGRGLSGTILDRSGYVTDGGNLYTIAVHFNGQWQIWTRRESDLQLI